MALPVIFLHLLNDVREPFRVLFTVTCEFFMGFQDAYFEISVQSDPIINVYDELSFKDIRSSRPVLRN